MDESGFHIITSSSACRVWQLSRDFSSVDVEIKDINGGASGVTGLFWHKTYGAIITTWLDGKIRLYDVAMSDMEAKRLRQYDHGEPIILSACSPGLKVFATASATTLKLWRQSRGSRSLEPTSEDIALKDRIKSLACSPTEIHIAATFDNGSIKVWNMQSLDDQHLCSTFRTSYGDSHSACTFIGKSSALDNLLATGDEKGRVFVWNLTNPQPQHEAFVYSSSLAAVTCMTRAATLSSSRQSTSPQPRLYPGVFGAATSSGHIAFFDATDGCAAVCRRSIAVSCTCLDVCGDGHHFVAGGDDGCVYIFDTRSTAPPARVRCHSEALTHLIVSHHPVHKVKRVMEHQKRTARSSARNSSERAPDSIASSSDAGSGRLTAASWSQSQAASAHRGTEDADLVPQRYSVSSGAVESTRKQEAQHQREVVGGGEKAVTPSPSTPQRASPAVALAYQGKQGSSGEPIEPAPAQLSTRSAAATSAADASTDADSVVAAVEEVRSAAELGGREGSVHSGSASALMSNRHMAHLTSPTANRLMTFEDMEPSVPPLPPLSPPHEQALRDLLDNSHQTMIDALKSLHIDLLRKMHEQQTMFSSQTKGLQQQISELQREVGLLRQENAELRQFYRPV